MQPRTLRAVAGLSLSALCFACFGGQRASAQNEAPFTIRRPPDGATVREKVKVLVPLASIPEGGYVAYYIDGQFRVALAPTAEQRENAKPNAMFEFVWDTKAPYKSNFTAKAEPPKDGEHEIAARLYAPTDNGPATALKDTSSVKINVQNRINAGDNPISLRYHFVDGQSRSYARTGSTSIVAGLTQGANGTEDQEMVAQNSDLTFSVEDRYPSGSAIVRNLLDKLTVRQGGQEMIYPQDALPKALYQEVTPTGHVTYQNNSATFEQFAQLGVPVSATLEMPILPAQPVRIGDKWQSSGVSLDLPGTPPDQQPKVVVDSTFEDIEWEGGYPTARIHQHYPSANGPTAKKLDSIVVGDIQVMNPQITFDQDIYVAYRSGTLVRVTRTLDITGKTMQAINLNGPGANMAGGPPSMGAPRMGGPVGAPGMPSGGPPPGVFGPGGMGGRGQGMPPSAGMMNRMRGGRGMMSGGGDLPSMPGSGGSMAGYSGGMGAGMAGPGSMGQQPTQITLKSVTTTELKR